MLAPKDHDASEKPKISRPKPTIASKPKYIPPVNLKVIPKSDLRLPCNKTSEPTDTRIPQSSKIQGPTVKISSIRPKNGFEPPKNNAPNSPSTICCSILSNSSDCCNIIGNKKDMESKSMSKIDSLDSNSSDSGGFRDFIQPEIVKKLPEERKIEGHIRKFSQPEFLEKSVAERAKCLSQSLSERNKSNEHLNEEIRRLPHKLIQFNPFQEKNDDKPKMKPIIIPGQIKQTTKKLEEVLAQRMEIEKKIHRRGASCHENEAQGHFEQQMNIQKEIQQKIQADLKQTVKHIQEIQSIELRLPQNRTWDDVCLT